MSKYKLIAFDMDGTLLNTQKKISKHTVTALNKAIDNNKHVVLSTGRAIVELSDYKKELSNLQYGICESGALIYDFKNKKIIHQDTIPLSIINEILDIAYHQDIMIHLLTNGNSVICKDDLEKMDKYNMEIYKSMFTQVATIVEDIYDYAKKNKIEKINLYHTTADARKNTYEILKNLPLSFALAETTSLEITSLNVTKAKGLKILCNYLNTNIANTIAVGDANNDLDILKTAGLAVAMGNANDNIKLICDVIVSDNDHDGCKEAIENYLL
ncbi:Cof-type HAD-IIB family hydrolase [Thomasclavelia cocleata]|uniref:Cof-type HAD-IIB family hydrolase n=1 Tax=Thomasclavelia cocleata TaxID=69824 RepID=UPI00248B4804|nr:Cof-type HAD-IIB family hydrolase [Thomasclavelia cocleata]